MKQQTYTQFDEDKLVMTDVTISSFTCPHCCKVVRFCVPPDNNHLKDIQVELEHYKELCRRLSKDNYDLKMFCRRLAQQ